MRAAISLAEPVRNYDFSFLARTFALGGAGMDRVSVSEAISLAEKSGASPRIVRVLKDAATIGSAVNWGDVSGANWDILTTFVESLAGESLFAWALEHGAVRVPLNSRALAVSNYASGTVVEKGAVKPLTNLAFAPVSQRALKCLAAVVTTEELAKQNISVVDTELRKAVVRGMDARLISAATAGAPTAVSVGSTDDAVRSDIRWLLDVVNLTGAESVILAMPPTVANGAAFINDGRGRFSPTGLSEFFGTPCLVSTQVPAETIIALDATGFIGEVETAKIRRSSQATLEMETTPDSPPAASTVLLSLWQQNLIAIMCEIYFGLQKHRTTAAAVLTDVSWMPSANSPA